MEFHIENAVVYGLDKSIIASGNSYRIKMKDNSLQADSKDKQRAVKLGSTRCGEGHDQFLAGIIVQFDLYAPLYMWKQLQRYKFLDFVSSQSTMHCLSRFKVLEQCTSDTSKEVVDICQRLVDDYNRMIDANKNVPNAFDASTIKKAQRAMIASLPCGFVLGATMTTNYRQLKTIYYQRKNHLLDE